MKRHQRLSLPEMQRWIVAMGEGLRGAKPVRHACSPAAVPVRIEVGRDAPHVVGAHGHQSQIGILGLQPDDQPFVSDKEAGGEPRDRRMNGE